jgi:hypothetical protein
VKSFADSLPKNLRTTALSMDQSATMAVHQYRFEPARLRGKSCPLPGENRDQLPDSLMARQQQDRKRNEYHKQNAQSYADHANQSPE